MNRDLVLLVVAVSLSFAVLACALPDYCENRERYRPTVLSPNSVIVSEHEGVVFSWRYSSGGFSARDNPCYASDFEIRIRPENRGAPQENLIVPRGDEGVTTTFETPLLPATYYRWDVRARFTSFSETTEGDWSSSAYFMTGPICEQGIGHPILQTPAENQRVAYRYYTFSWTWSEDDCIPEGYRIELYPKDDPQDGLLVANISDPPFPHWRLDRSLKECTEYRWSVRPVVDDVVGAPSNEGSFYFATGENCGAIRGTVYHDVCALPDEGPVPNAAPPGCIDDGQDGYIANGVLEAGESGLEGVTVHLGSGTCPSEGLATTVAGADGGYWFPALANGNYCVSIDASSEGNSSILNAGVWSEPAGEVVAQQEFVVRGSRINGNFGWDYQFLPSARTARLSGYVWQDVCMLPLDGIGAESIPEGCVEGGSGGFEADGLQAAEEAGIPGVSVELGYGPCPSTGAYAVVTDEAGYYLIPGLLEGTYCLTVDATAQGNDVILLSGEWTHPDRGVNPQQVQVEISQTPEEVNTVVSRLDFGWSYQIPQIGLAGYSGVLNSDAYCREGSGLYYQVIQIVPEGELVSIRGRDADSLWLVVLPSSGDVQCWLRSEKVDFSFPIETLPVVDSPPLRNGSIDGYAFYDFNLNARMDGDDAGIPGQEIGLMRGACPGNQLVGVAATPGSGYYRFNNLAPGPYCLIGDASLPGLTPARHSITLLSGENRRLYFYTQSE